MLRSEFTISKAVECDLRAARCPDREEAAEWLLMASEWRVASVANDPGGVIPPPPPRPLPRRLSGLTSLPTRAI